MLIKLGVNTDKLENSRCVRRQNMREDMAYKAIIWTCHWRHSDVAWCEAARHCAAQRPVRLQSATTRGGLLDCLPAQATQ